MNNDHPEPVDIAALDEDLLTGEEATRVRRHVEGCAACADVQADLAALRQALAAYPGAEDGRDEPIPDDVAARIDAALAAEDAPVALSSSAPVPVASVSRETGGRRWPRMALAAASALVAIGLGGIAVQALGSGAGEPRDTAGEAAARGDSGEGEPEARPGDGADEALEADVRELLAESDVDADTLAAPSEEENGAPHPPEESVPEGDSGGEEDGGTTGGAAEDGAAVGPEHQGGPDPSTDATGDPQVPACVTSAIGRSESPLAADEDRYQGVNAFLVVLPHSADPERVDAYVVDAECTTASHPVDGEVLVRQSYPLE